VQLYRNNNIITNVIEHKGTIETKTFTHRDTRIGQSLGKNPTRGKPFQILLIRLSLNVTKKRECNYPYLQPQNYLKKSTKQQPRDEPNNDNNKNPNSEACGQLPSTVAICGQPRSTVKIKP